MHKYDIFSFVSQIEDNVNDLTILENYFDYVPKERQVKNPARILRAAHEYFENTLTNMHLQQPGEEEKLYYDYASLATVLMTLSSKGINATATAWTPSNRKVLIYVFDDGVVRHKTI